MFEIISSILAGILISILVYFGCQNLFLACATGAGLAFLLATLWKIVFELQELKRKS